MHTLGNTGSYRYMAPEVGLGLTYNEQVDVYGYGVILYECLTNEKAFDDISRDSYNESVYVGDFRPPLAPVGSNLQDKHEDINKSLRVSVCICLHIVMCTVYK